MKKLMMVLAVAGMVAGCAHNRNTGGTSDQNEINSGSESNAAAQDSVNSNSNAVSNPGQPQP
jgi:hypothetical protein